MPSDALYSVYFRAKGEGKDKQAKDRVYSFAFKNKRYYLGCDDDIRRGFNLSPKDFSEDTEKTPEEPKKIDSLILAYPESRAAEKIDSTDSFPSLFQPVPEQAISSKMSVSIPDKYSLKDAQEALASDKKITGTKAAHMLRDLGFPLWGKSAEETREKLKTVVAELSSAAAPPANVLVQGFDSSSSDDSDDEEEDAERSVDEFRAIVEGVEERVAAKVIEVASAFTATISTLTDRIAELTQQVAALQKQIAEQPAPAPKPAKKSSSAADAAEPAAEPKRVVEKIPVAHKSTKDLHINDILNDGETVFFNIGKDDGTHEIVSTTVVGECLQLPDAVSISKRFPKSPTTALKTLKLWFVETGKRKDVGSTTDDGWRKAFVVRDGQEVRLISIPKK